MKKTLFKKKEPIDQLLDPDVKREGSIDLVDPQQPTTSQQTISQPTTSQPTSQNQPTKQPQQNTTPISLIADFDHNNQQSIRLAVDQIQKKFDLNPQVIETWLNRPEFIDELNDLDKKAYVKTICQQKHTTLNRLLDVTYPDTFVDDHLFWEKEKCGQIVDEYKNGFIKYCNKHKYLHPDRKNRRKPNDKPLKSSQQLTNQLNNSTNQLNKSTDQLKSSTDQVEKKELTPELKEKFNREFKTHQDECADHYFVDKNPKEILDEQIFVMMFNVYVQYSRSLANSLENLFYQYLNQKMGYLDSYVSLNEIKSSTNWFKNHPSSFRGKSCIFTNQSQEYVKIFISREDQTSTHFKTLKKVFD